MAKDKKSKSKKKPKISNARLFALAHDHFKAAGEEKKWKGKKDAIKVQILDGMKERSAKTIEEADTGLRITFSQATGMKYDGEGIRKDKGIKKSIKDRIFRKKINLSVLPKERQAELIKVMHEALTPAELRACVEFELMEDEMSRCVQEGKLTPKQLAPHAEPWANEPYVTISMRGGAG